jgi:hypothetical protein
METYEMEFKLLFQILNSFVHRLTSQSKKAKSRRRIKRQLGRVYNDKKLIIKLKGNAVW